MPRTTCLVLGHQGDPTHAPANTIPSFRAALAGGADGIETDIHLSADGVAFLRHDDDLATHLDAAAHGIDPAAQVELLPWSRLRELDAGSWFDPTFAGERLPLLSDLPGVLSDGLVDLEIKAPSQHSAADVVRVVHEALVSPAWSALVGTGRVVVTSFSPDVVEDAVSRLAPLGVAVGLITATTPPVEEIAALKPLGVDLLVTDHASLDAEAAAAARAAGLATWVWTPNEAEEWDRLLDLGVDAICTDDPVGLRAHLDARG